MTLPALRTLTPATRPARAVLRQTLYALTRSVGDLSVGTMVEICTGDGHPAVGAFVVQDGAERHAYVVADDVALVSGLTVLVDHVDGQSIAFGGWTEEHHARTFAARLMAADLPAAVGVWVGEVIRQH